MWQSQIEPLARSMMDGLPSDRPVDLVGEFAQPWCAELACIVTGVDRKDCRQLTELARLVSAAAADPDDPALKSTASAANDELQRRVPVGSIPMAGPAFVALSQTLPAFLARAWLALLRHPTQVSRLRENAGLVPGAIEELLRYAGLARVIFRVARTALDLSGVRIAEGERVALMLNSANRDPDRFAEPNRLDLARQAAGHVAFGSGSHSCVGASLIRMPATVATTALVQKFGAAEVRLLCETPRETSDDYMRRVLQVRLDSSEWSLRAAQAAMLHAGARGYLAGAPAQRRLRESYFVAIVTPATKHLRRELAALAGK